MGRFLLPLVVSGLTIIAANSALAKGGPLHLFKSQSPPVSRAGVPTPSLLPSDFLSGAVVGATAIVVRIDAEVPPMLAINSRGGGRRIAANIAKLSPSGAMRHR